MAGMAQAVAVCEWSLVAGLLARQAFALALASGSALWRRLTAGNATNREAAREP